ncbi:hypothetical protein [Lignipirellula cremea]|uniref:Uncharacterized protein n=1 Tax=Lignipirellula cremea TaxID=2528010 RepID=A0A518E1P7_9BACT|nr:hypothetical protein [Lignipirellula cremea]QDU97992.1 hypothetical protein Pla8534_58520 [Lignipirellula cremea]
MQEYKKRVRLLAERYGASIDYANDDGLTLTTLVGSICFTPTSKSDMNCKITRQKTNVAFTCPKAFVFDIVDRFATGKPLDGYKPKGNPLTLQEYIDEEHATERVSQLKNRIVAGTANNGELGGNHYNAEYFNGILVLFDIFTGAPTNVVELT